MAEYAVLVDGKLVKVANPGEGKLVVHVPFGEFDQESEIVVFSHYEETGDEILVHPKIIPAEYSVEDFED